MDSKSLEFKHSFSSSKVATILADVTITITIFNKSNTNILHAQVAVKDNDSNQAVSANFGAIPAHTSSVQTVSLPGGVDWAIYAIYPAVGEIINGFGAAANVNIVNLTITD